MGGALYEGEDQWVAVFDPEEDGPGKRDWMQVGDKCHHPGKSHVLECRHYPPWGDDKYNKRYGNPTWNFVKLWTSSETCDNKSKISGTKGGYWTAHKNIDMCGIGDVEILQGKTEKNIEELKKICEKKGYSAISVGCFPFAGLKKFDYQLEEYHCHPSKGYTNTLYIYHQDSQEKSQENSPVKTKEGLEKLNTALNNKARNTNDVEKIRKMVKLGADLLSTNGAPWYHTPLHQACYHGRPEVVKVLVELLKEQGILETNLTKKSNPCGRGAHGLPIELAKGGGHKEIVRILESCGSAGSKIN